MNMLRGRRVVITGAGRGIGRAVAELFVRQGADVMVNDADEKPLEETVSRCVELAGDQKHVAGSTGSVADAEYARRLMQETAETLGGVDILVNNAGVTRDGVVHRMSHEDWDQVLAVNLTGAFNCVQAAAPYLRDPAKAELKATGEVGYHRKVINVASTAAARGNAGQVNYGAAKMGVVGLTRSLAREWAPFRINVNCVVPGFTDTRLTQAPRDGLGIPPEQREAFIATLPFGRPAAPADVAKVFLFLAGDLSDWVTGQEINASGGHQIP